MREVEESTSHVVTLVPSQLIVKLGLHGQRLSPLIVPGPWGARPAGEDKGNNAAGVETSKTSGTRNNDAGGETSGTGNDATVGKTSRTGNNDVAATEDGVTEEGAGDVNDAFYDCGDTIFGSEHEEVDPSALKGYLNCKDLDWDSWDGVRAPPGWE